MQLSPRAQETLLHTARDSIRRRLAGVSIPGPDPAPSPDDPELGTPVGCFVSLHELHTKRLRGCVGRLESAAPLIQTVAEVAGSVLSDQRFSDDRVLADELPDLELELTVLSPLSDARDPLDFDLLENGIALTINDRTACFLPQVARETGWSREQLLDRLVTEKLQLAGNAWRDRSVKLRKFTALIIGPRPFCEGP